MNILKFDQDKLFFVSDSHFCHEAIIKYCGRPFISVEEMNETIIKNWNSVVGPKDTVFHLGDFGLGSLTQMTEIREQLNGEIYLILGNHDLRQSKGFHSLFKEVSFEMVIEVGKTKLILNHYPLLCFSGSRSSRIWNLFGHVHSREKTGGYDAGRLQHLFPTQYDVGVDNNDFTPVSFEQLKQIIQQKISETKQCC